MSRNGKVSVTQDTVTMDSAVQFVLTNVPRAQLLETRRLLRSDRLRVYPRVEVTQGRAERRKLRVSEYPPSGNHTACLCLAWLIVC